GQRTLTAADTVEQRLDAVRELADEAETERARAAFDRMRRAEDRVDALTVARRVEDLVVEQLAFHEVQALEALFEEGLDELGYVDAHGRRRVVPSAEHPLDRRAQRLRVEGFDEPARRARRFAFLLLGVARLGREQQDRRELVFRQPAQLAYERDAVHARHV